LGKKLILGGKEPFILKPFLKVGAGLNPTVRLALISDPAKVCLFRFVNPNKEIRVAGGREVNLRSLQPLSLYPANSIFVVAGSPPAPRRAPRRSESIYSRQSESRKPLANASRRRRSL
jgi:hypothetical protein